jgi:hypothetical protein
MRLFGYPISADVLICKKSDSADLQSVLLNKRHGLQIRAIESEDGTE